MAANQRLYIIGYRIGDSEIIANHDHRIVATNNNAQTEYEVIGVSDSRLTTNACFNVSVPAGQEVVKWIAYNSNPINAIPVQTNKFADAVTGYVWSYNPSDTANKYIVVDFDYITYTLKYNSGSGSTSSESHIYTNNFTLASNQFSKTGYSFDGWTNNTGAVFADMASVSGESFGVTYTNEATKTATLYAKWTPNTYIVTLDPCKGTVAPGSVSVTYDAAWPALPTPTRDGYYFDGWYNDDKYYTRTPTNSNVAITENAIIYAKWTQRLTATFIDPIDSTTQLVYVAYGSMPTAPFTPNHPGYAFSGWSPNLSNIYEDRIYTAQFTGSQYFITYHSNFGSPEKTRQIDYVYGTAKAALDGAIEFPRVGYTFKGWTTSEDSNQIRFHAGDDIVTFSTEGDALYAVWEPIEYHIGFDANGGEGEMDDVSVKYGEAYTVTNCTFTKTGVSFVGWTTNVANGAEFYVGDSVSNLTTIADANVTFYAIWSEPRYIAFDGNGANDVSAMANDVMTFEGVETNKLVSNKFEKTGYTFAGWATNETTAAVLDVAYIDGAEVVSTNLWRAIGETNVLFAVWQTNTYTVVFNANGGIGSMDAQEFVYDQAQALTKCKFSSNLKFQGWATSQSGDKLFGDEATVSNLTAEMNGIVMLYAVWDNGKLSKAMHCDNLFWMQDDSSAGTGNWEACIGDEEGYNPSDSLPSGSSVCATVPGDEKQSYVMMPSGASGGGRLSFWYKMSNADQCWLNFSANGTSELFIDPKTEWTQYGPVDIEDIANVYLTFSLSESSYSWVEYKVYIDQMTWVLDGQEPTEEDKPTINGFAKTTDGFALTVDQTNISDSFSYQILATNELVNGDWPVKETLTADELKSGYEIVIDENEPQMFYKVKVVPK